MTVREYGQFGRSGDRLEGARTWSRSQQASRISRRGAVRHTGNSEKNRLLLVIPIHY